jgi:ferrous iron transport protein B
MLQKLWLRIREFLQEAVPLVWIAVLAVNVLYFLGVFNALANFTAPVVAKMFGLPKEAVVAIIIGFLRKDVALGMLAASVITAKQMVIGAVVLSMFFPCLASFVVLFRELGGRNLLAATAVMLFSALLAGGLLNIML